MGGCSDRASATTQGCAGLDPDALTDSDHAPGADRKPVAVLLQIHADHLARSHDDVLVQDRVAHHGTAPTRVPGMITLPSTIAPSSTTTLDDSTELRTDAAEMMLPAPTTDSCAEPPLTNLAGASISVSLRIGHRLL